MASVDAKTLLAGDRAALSRAVTLIESTRDDHQKEAQALLTALLPETGNSIRIGITGAPGVGKSTFIEALGLHAIDQGHKVAVLAVDPSSIKSGGSILGDKTRMTRLAQNENAYIRPSPAAGSLGGVARRTREAMLLTEAAGFDVVLVETVGVGQSETEVASMTDMFVLMLLPGSGDELQGIKKGIVELADLIIVNKADGELLTQARRVRADYAAAIKMLHASGAWQPKVLTCSALNGDGIAEAWEAIREFTGAMRESGELKRKRAEQAKAWMWKEIRETLLGRFLAHPQMEGEVEKMEAAVQRGEIAPTAAALQMIERFSG
jgi:LAO/AO transport system kinase